MQILQFVHGLSTGFPRFFALWDANAFSSQRLLQVGHAAKRRSGEFQRRNEPAVEGFLPAGAILMLMTTTKTRSGRIALRSDRDRTRRDSIDRSVEEAVRTDLDWSLAPTRPRVEAAAGECSSDDVSIDTCEPYRNRHRLSERPS